VKMGRMQKNVMKRMLFWGLVSASGLLAEAAPDIKSLVEAEKAFAQMAIDKGFRESFLANFTEEGIAFTPHPSRSNEGLRRLPPPPPDAPKSILRWRPDFSDISRAGDLGYNTGPFWLAKPDGTDVGTQQGYFFSVWRRQPDNTWKVVLDVGAGAATLPQVQRELPWRQAKSPGYRAKASEAAGEQVAAVKALEAHSAGWDTPRYQQLLAEESRLHADNRLPTVGREQVIAHLRETKFQNMRQTPMFADVASSSDLAYSYGRYTLERAGGAAAEKGYYAHVWKRNPAGKWQLVLEVRSPLPTEKKP
jgi:ketosteroid isomerase-like protein